MAKVIEPLTVAQEPAGGGERERTPICEGCTTPGPCGFMERCLGNYTNATPTPQAAGVSEEAIMQAVARGWCDPLLANRAMDVDLVKAITREVVAALTAAGAAPEGCIRVSRVLAETAAIVAAEWLDLFAETPGLEKYERYTYGPQVEVLRDDLKAALAAVAPAGTVLVPRDEIERAVKVMRYAAHPHPSPNADALAQFLVTPPATAGEEEGREAWPARFGCNGPEGTFWTDDSELANELIRAAFDRDEWTVTDMTNPTGRSP